MTRIVVVAKENKILVQDTQSREISLDQPAIIQVGVTKQDVKSLTKSGNNLIITLKNGEQIVLENFFTVDTAKAHSLTFPESNGSFVVANFDANGKFVNYSGLQKLDALLYEGADTVAVQQVQAYQSTATGASETDFSFSNLLSSSAVKAGLGIAAAVGLGLALIDGDSSTKTSSDITAPKAPTATLSEDGKTIKGTGEAGTTITVIDKDKKVVATTTVDKDGNYSVELPEALLNNNVYSVVSKDKAGNSSSTNVTGTKDTIAPDEPQAQLNDLGNVVSGKSEPNATVNVYDPDGTLIGTAKVRADGEFIVSLKPALTAGQIGTVEVVDPSGNKSPKHNIELGKDTIAPDQPKLEVSSDGASVKGTAENGAKVIIQDATGTVIGTGVVDENGQFVVTVSPALSSTTAGKIVIEDAAGNQSEALEIKVGTDTFAPEQPVAKVNPEGTVITGTAEPNSKITVNDSNKKVLGTATTDANGNYTVTLSTVLTEDKSATVSATDAAGNESKIITVTGTKDVSADPPKFTKIDDDVGDTKGDIKNNTSTDDKRPVITGTGEAGATVIIYDNGKALGSVIVDTDGKWSFSFESDLSIGSHSITAVQTDKSGNTSLTSDARTFTVVETAVETNSVNGASLNHDLSDTAASSTAIGISSSPVTEPSSIAQVLGNVDDNTNVVHSSSTVDVDVNDLILVNTFDSVTSPIDQVIANSIPQSAQDISSDHPRQLTTTNSDTVLGLPIVQSDTVADLLNPQVITF